MKDIHGGSNELFNKNKKLVYYVYHKIIKELPKDFVSQHGDDLKQEGLIGLWKASERFDESKGCEFSTYAISLIRGYILQYVEKIRRTRRKEQPQIVSLEAEITGNITLYETLQAKENKDVSWILEDKRLTEYERKIVKLLYDGYKQEEIASFLKVCQPHISRIIKRIGKKLKNDF